MEKLPTIDDLSHRYLAFFKPRTGYEAQPNIREMMLEFTKAHVAEALKKASEAARLSKNGSDVPYGEHSSEKCGTWRINHESILNAYPLENIK